MTRGSLLGFRLIPPVRRSCGALMGLVLLALQALWPQAVSGQHAARQAYAKAYGSLAIKKMEQHGIPASITLAQGMLESGNGLSRLAMEGRNHFGIKCHKTWEGKRIYQDDDALHECFRAYSTVEQSFEDHSSFLRGTRRYAFLFDLSPTDYKGWAQGLQMAGYATDRRYARRLIDIIEEEQLYLYDQGIAVEVPSPNHDAAPTVAHDAKLRVRLGGAHQVYSRNRVEYIVVQPHDTYESLTRAMEMMPWELQRYNELPARKLPAPGAELYIQPKRRKADIAHATHVVEAGETLYSIAQKYAVKMKCLLKRNHLEPDQPLEAGQLIYLRKRAPRR